jgi:phosphoglycerate dehydrogenase-like enzyme
MDRLRIFVDLEMAHNDLRLLRTKTAGHELILPQTPVPSVLAKAAPDPQFETADIAFGQPDPQAIAHARSLKWIHISSSGITRYDNPEFRALMTSRQIVVSNSATVFQEACATHALSFILAQARKLPRALVTRSAHTSSDWKALRGSSAVLRGETLLIMGYGAIGRRLAELLQPLGLNVIACRRKSDGSENVPMVTSDQVDRAICRADHIMNILPDSVATRNFFDASRFALMKPGAIFYNIGRGATVDQRALAEALHTGRVGAAWLDVTEPEPLPEGHPLLASPNCFITPHTAGGHADETKTLVCHFLDNFSRYVRGEALIDRVM